MTGTQRTLAAQRWLAPFALTLALVAAAHRLLPSESARFVPPAVRGLTAAPQPAVAARLLPNPQPSAHAATLAELADGRLAAAWFGGSAEGARDVAIYLAIFDGREWSAPRPIISRERVQRETGRLVRKLGNPLLAVDGRGRLHLWFVSVGFGGWAGSSINHAESADGGVTWSSTAKFVTSPFWNFSTLVRTPPLPLADGGWGLPAYHEFAAKRAEWLRLDAAGRVIDKARIPGAERTLQPAVAALDERRAIALMRDAGPSNRVRAAASADGGSTWAPARNTELPNPNASVALLRLHDGRLLLTYNPQTANRNKLALATSRDGGATWSVPRLIEDASGGEEFSYPALLQGRDGTIHLAYTWQRRTIKHVAFSPAWPEARE